MVQREQDLVERADGITTLGDYLGWLQQCHECIAELEEHSHVKRPRLSIGSRQSLVARIARLESVKCRVERRFVHFGGGGVGTSRAQLSWREIDTAFENRVLTGAVINAEYIEPRKFLEDARDIVIEHVRDAIERYNCVKVNTAFNGEFVAGDKRANKSINTKNCKLFITTDLQLWYESRVIGPTLVELEEFQERDSGWALSRILNLTINVNKCNPMRAGCHIDVPEVVKRKKAVINVQSMDNACFAWSVVAALYPAERNVGRESSYPHYSDVLNLRDVPMPMTLSGIKKFERLNSISINMYSIDEKNNCERAFVPLRVADEKKEQHVNLLYLQDQGVAEVGHFVWIKNLSRLVSSQLSKHKEKKYICDR
ncbi:PREDICTED: uncharacterized protein LOC105557042 [Vollenhovia emeryi]|uniref:uncharacterized protein LOC105557042 n=1 Tax=Vollenhovia emeryi TaxID=411798 RepID=UPI0005F45E07|nr:PREDICTED: uncharacterized protein LOC105557042 [Vollenhovia emeryi]